MDAMTRTRRGAIVLAVFLSACYSPAIDECTITCGAASACPTGFSCEGDGFCHGGVLSSCLRLPDGGVVVVLPDAPPAGGPPDGRPRPMIDAPPRPVDARPAPDAFMCPGSTAGEPDDSCPGEGFDVEQGTLLSISGRVLAPERDVDVYRLTPHLVRPLSCATASQQVTFAVRAGAVGPGGTAFQLGKPAGDVSCGLPPKHVGTTVCVAITVSCSTLPGVGPAVAFEVRSSANQTGCLPYTLGARVCVVGNECEACPP